MRKIDWAVASAAMVGCLVCSASEAQVIDEGKRTPPALGWASVVGSICAVGFIVWRRKR